MTAEEMMTMKSLMGDRQALTPFEATTIAQREGKRINGATVTAIVLGGGAIVLSAAAWIGSTMYACAKNKGNERAIDILAAQAMNERNERVNQAPKLVDYINVQSGAFAGAGSNSASNALAQAEAQIVSNALTGRMQTCPTPVALYSAPQPCGCPCSCNG